MFVEHKEVGEAKPFKLGTLKLSEAMRIGAKLRPPVENTENYFDNCGSCALGAAYQAMTGTVLHGEHYRDDGKVIRQFLQSRGIEFGTLTQVCDWFHQKVSREEIADRLQEQGL